MDRWGKEREIDGQAYGEEDRGGLYGLESERCRGDMKIQKRKGFTQ